MPKLQSEQVRILSNYARMLITLALGLLFVRMMVAVDNQLYVVVALLGTSIGVAGIFKEAMRGSMVPELGLALHSGSVENFNSVFVNSFVIAAGAALFAISVLAAFYYFLTSFQISPDLLYAAKVFLLTRVIVTVVAIMAAPSTNLLPINGKMASMNIWMVLERGGEVAAAAIAIYLSSSESSSAVLITFSWMSAAAMTSVTLGWAVHGLTTVNGIRFLPNRISLSILARIAKTIGWNSFVSISFNLYFRFDMFIINILFGSAATFVFAIATQMLNYSRQLTTGIVQGLDSVFAKLHSESEKGGSDHLMLMRQSGTMQALTTLSGCGFLMIYSPQIFQLWVGDKIDGDTLLTSNIVLTCRIMLIGVVARNLSEGWMRYLSGTGEVRRYAPILMVGAVLNPCIIFALYYTFDSEQAYWSVPVTFSALFVIVHLIALPKLTASIMKTRMIDLLSPSISPLLHLLVAAGICITIQHFSNLNQLFSLIVGVAVFAVVFLRPLYCTMFATSA